MICADELGPLIPRTLPPAPAWSPDGHRIKAELDYSCGPEKTWVYGGLRPADGQALTMTASSRNSVFYQQFLQPLEDANLDGGIWIVTDNLSSHNSLSTRSWLEDHPASTTPSSPSARAGSTSRKAGGASSAKPRSAASHSPTGATSNTPPPWRPTSSTPVPNSGSGADSHHQPACYEADIRTSFEESSTRPFRSTPARHSEPVSRTNSSACPPTRRPSTSPAAASDASHAKAFSPNPDEAATRNGLNAALHGLESAQPTAATPA
ncbi:transposase [Streptomyces sp. NBC_01283]|nr:transposase [Streptomyces sp. NBC_01283]